MHTPFPLHAGRAARLALLLGLSLLLGCTTVKPLLPAELPGQLPKDAKLDQGRALILARISVTTNGEAGFGGISNPLLVELRHTGVTPPDENPQGLTLPHPTARVWGAERDLPTLWRFEQPGLMAASFRPGSYDGLVMAYPDTSGSSSMPDSIPAPTRGMRFAPVEAQADEIVYLGDIHIEQSYGFWDKALDRVQVTYAVTDDYDKSVADFRARYPQFAETPVHKRLAKVVATAP